MKQKSVSRFLRLFVIIYILSLLLTPASTDSACVQPTVMSAAQIAEIVVKAFLIKWVSGDGKGTDGVTLTTRSKKKGKEDVGTSS